MPQPRVLILRAPGTNCDLETAYAFELAGAHCERVHINQLQAETDRAKQFQILCLPGGFSYGDDIAAGRILANRIQHDLAEMMIEFRQAKKLVLGICNGFQVLIKSGLLVAGDGGPPTATLTWNDSGRFEDRWVHLGTEATNCVFLRNVEAMYLPVAHAEGKFVMRDAAKLADLRRSGELALSYINGSNSGSDLDTVGYPANPNGSQANVAGVCDPSGHVFGLMPHPERHIDPTHHPQWTRGSRREHGDGFALFRNAVEYFV